MTRKLLHKNEEAMGERKFGISSTLHKVLGNRVAGCLMWLMFPDFSTGSQKKIIGEFFNKSTKQMASFKSTSFLHVHTSDTVLLLKGVFGFDLFSSPYPLCRGFMLGLFDGFDGFNDF